MGSGLEKLIGLTREKARFRVQLVRCKQKNLSFPHTLLHGIGGTGKTALARAMSHELGYYLVEVEAAELKNRDIINDLLIGSLEQARNKNQTLFLFIDEVHRLSSLQQEAFYYPMKEWRVIQMVKHVRQQVELTPFTFVAATTRLDMLDVASLVKRFPNKWKIEQYDKSHIADIIADIFDAEGLSYGPDVLEGIAGRCLGVPRTAHNLAMKVIDQVYFRRSKWVEMDDLRCAFELEGIDRIGLDGDCVKYLRELVSAGGSPRGLDYLAGRLSIDGNTIEDTIEPVLLSLGFIDRSRTGRIITQAGHRHLAT